MKYLIYAHINKINYKYYIGQTILDPKERWRNGKGYQRQPKFYRAIKKYTWKNFEHKILEECSTIEEANKQEKYWIEYYDSIKNGYNVSIGGSIPQYFCKAVYQLDADKNIIALFTSTREASRLTGIPQANISHCCIGKINSANGFWWCYINNYDNYICEPMGLSKGQPLRVEQYSITNEFITSFDSLSAAEKATNIPHQNISKCCNNKLKQAGGFIWRFENEKRKNKN